MDLQYDEVDLNPESNPLATLAGQPSVRMPRQDFDSNCNPECAPVCRPHSGQPRVVPNRTPVLWSTVTTAALKNGAVSVESKDGWDLTMRPARTTSDWKTDRLSLETDPRMLRVFNRTLQTCVDHATIFKKVWRDALGENAEKAYRLQQDGDLVPLDAVPDLTAVLPIPYVSLPTREDAEYSLRSQIMDIMDAQAITTIMPRRNATDQDQWGDAPTDVSEQFAGQRLRRRFTKAVRSGLRVSSPCSGEYLGAEPYRGTEWGEASLLNHVFLCGDREYRLPLPMKTVLNVEVGTFVEAGQDLGDYCRRLPEDWYDMPIDYAWNSLRRIWGERVLFFMVTEWVLSQAHRVSGVMSIPFDCVAVWATKFPCGDITLTGWDVSPMQDLRNDVADAFILPPVEFDRQDLAKELPFGIRLAPLPLARFSAEVIPNWNAFTKKAPSVKAERRAVDIVMMRMESPAEQLISEVCAPETQERVSA